MESDFGDLYCVPNGNDSSGGDSYALVIINEAKEDDIKRIIMEEYESLTDVQKQEISRFWKIIRICSA